MNARDYWEAIYHNPAADAGSWYRPHLETSLEMIRGATGNSQAAILDVGGGESTLVDDLIAAGYENVAVLDISDTALERAKKRLGSAAERVGWISGDVTDLLLPQHSIDVWHDRAVFHFLTAAEERAAYVRGLLACVRPGGHAIVAAFGPDGPERCSGLRVVRYDCTALQRELGASVVTVESREEIHLTPDGKAQQFIYCRFRVETSGVAQKA